jgi:poly(hydroxyalkanoate) granule-associated protein
MVTRKKAQTPTGLKGTANDIWLAGLGAFNLAGEEGGKIFKALVKRGREQKKTNQEWMEGLTERTEGLKEDARSLLDKVTTPIEDGLAAAMQRLGVPTRSEIINLTHRVEALTRHVAKAKPAPKPAPRPKPRAKAKPKAKAAQATTA